MVRFSSDIEIFKGGILSSINRFTNHFSAFMVTITLLIYISKWTIVFLIVVVFLIIKFVRPIIYAKH